MSFKGKKLKFFKYLVSLVDAILWNNQTLFNFQIFPKYNLFDL